MDRKSADAFRTISEVSEILGIPAHVLRFWETRFAQVRPVKRSGGRRYFRPADIALLGGIRHLLHDEGMTIRTVQKLLKEKGVSHVMAMADISVIFGAEDEETEPASPDTAATETAPSDSASPVTTSAAPEPPVTSAPPAPAETAPSSAEAPVQQAAPATPAPQAAGKGKAPADPRQIPLFGEEAPIALDVVPEEDIPPQSAEVIPLATPRSSAPRPAEAAAESTAPALPVAKPVPPATSPDLAALAAWIRRVDPTGMSLVERIRLIALRDRIVTFRTRLDAPPEAARR